MITYGVFKNNIKVSAEQVGELIGADKGKSSFCLLPGGEIRLRVFVVSDNKYEFFTLPEDYEVKLINCTDKNTYDSCDYLKQENDGAR